MAHIFDPDVEGVNTASDLDPGKLEWLWNFEVWHESLINLP
jgi:hypothetical protein